MEPDRKSVTLEFKFSKNYNSIGGAVSLASTVKPDETNEDCFERIFKELDREADTIYGKVKELLG